MDLNVIKYANRINGFKSINCTKLDVLSGIPDIEVATHYTLDGKKLDGAMPSCYSDLIRVKVHTETLPGWTEDISQCTSFDSLPTNAQGYISFIEKEVGVPISWIGTGPEREAMFLHNE